MQSFSGDGVHSVLDSTTTGCRTRAVLAPAPFTINCACRNVARTLFFIAVAMRTIKVTFVSIDEAVFTSLQATTALSGAFSPSTPLSTDMFLGWWGIFLYSWWRHHWDWGSVKCTCLVLPSCLLSDLALCFARLLLRFSAQRSAMLEAILFVSLFAQFFGFDRLSSEAHTCTLLESQILG
jgi:hypothetical protein